MRQKAECHRFEPGDLIELTYNKPSLGIVISQDLAETEIYAVYWLVRKIMVGTINQVHAANMQKI